IGVAKPPEGTGLIFDRSSFPGKIPCDLMFCQAWLALSQKIINVAAHMMDTGELQNVLGFDCDSLCKSQFHKCFAMAVGYTSPIGKNDSNAQFHLCSLGAARKMRKCGQCLGAVRHCLMICIADASIVRCLEPMMCSSFDFSSFHKVVSEHFGRSVDDIASLR